ncbi:MAG: hypothetical protein DMG13_13010 [Acidobacteria bacterium]|nr:MAG: hypothetical protein DMG13_13010 [Acidobacteriota bacterium]
MDYNKTEEGSGNQNAEKPLPRGLENVSHLFLSHAQPERGAPENTRNASGEQKRATPGDQLTTVVLRPSRFLGREQLVSLLRKQTASLEQGMKAIDVNIPCETSGNIELLALDGTNRLAVIDVDDYPNDALLLRGISQVDWITRNLANVRRMYQGQVIEFSLQPRLFLVAPEFSPLFRCATRQITSIQIHCLKYHAIALPGGSGVLFEHVAGSECADPQ